MPTQVTRIPTRILTASKGKLIFHSHISPCPFSISPCWEVLWGFKCAMRNDKLPVTCLPWVCCMERRADRSFGLSLTLFGGLNHKCADLLIYLPFTAFRAFYLALLIFAYRHHDFKTFLAVQASVLISRHSYTSCVASTRLSFKNYSEL